MDIELKPAQPQAEDAAVALTKVRRRFTRRDFLLNSAALPPLIAALFAAPVVVSCGDTSSSSKKSSSDDDDSDDDSGDTSGDIASNHGHSVEITEVQLKAGDAVQLTFSGGTHTHTLDLTAAQVANIADGVKVTETSSTTSSHEHDVTFN